MNDRRALPPELEASLARYRAGSMAAGERAEFERRALADEALAEALYGELSLDRVRRAAETAEAPRVASVTTLRPARRRGIFGRPEVLVPLAAGLLAVSALALWSLRPRSPRPGGDWVRGESMLTALEPVGTLAAAPTVFRWNRDPGAAGYRVELYDTSGNAIGTAVSRDTVLAFGRVAHGPLAAGEWRVVAIGPDGLDRPVRARASFQLEAR